MKKVGIANVHIILSVRVLPFAMTILLYMHAPTDSSNLLHFSTSLPGFTSWLIVITY
jgi:hypothetical protein